MFVFDSSVLLKAPPLLNPESVCSGRKWFFPLSMLSRTGHHSYLHEHGEESADGGHGFEGELITHTLCILIQQSFSNSSGSYRSPALRALRENRQFQLGQIYKQRLFLRHRELFYFFYCFKPVFGWWKREAVHVLHVHLYRTTWNSYWRAYGTLVMISHNVPQKKP